MASTSQSFARSSMRSCVAGARPLEEQYGQEGLVDLWGLDAATREWREQGGAARAMSCTVRHRARSAGARRTARGQK